MGSPDFGRDINQVHYDNWGSKFVGKDNGTYILHDFVDTRSTDGTLIGGSSDNQRPYQKGMPEGDRAPEASTLEHNIRTDEHQK